jgi:hypothetical protein
MARNSMFWNQLLMRSDSIGDIDPQAADAGEQVIAQLSTIGEQFDRVFDPADQFEEYVAVALCQALRRALTPKSTTVCKMLAPKVAPTDEQAAGRQTQTTDIATKPTAAPAAAATTATAMTENSGAKRIGKKTKKRK